MNLTVFLHGPIPSGVPRSSRPFEDPTKLKEIHVFCFSVASLFHHRCLNQAKNSRSAPSKAPALSGLTARHAFILTSCAKEFQENVVPQSVRLCPVVSASQGNKIFPIGKLTNGLLALGQAWLGRDKKSKGTHEYVGEKYALSPRGEGKSLGFRV